MKDIKKGDRVVVSFDIGCGCCYYCNKELYTSCVSCLRLQSKPAEQRQHRASTLRTTFCHQERDNARHCALGSNQMWSAKLAASAHFLYR